MYNFLLECTQVDTNFISCEITAILKASKSYFSLYKIENTSLYMVTCDIETIGYVINRSVFVKQVNFYGFCCLEELKNVILSENIVTYNTRNKIQKNDKPNENTIDILKNCESDNLNEHCCNIKENKPMRKIFECQKLQKFADRLISDDFTAKIILTTINKQENKVGALSNKQLKRNAKKMYKENKIKLNNENETMIKTHYTNKPEIVHNDCTKKKVEKESVNRTSNNTHEKYKKKQQEIEAYKKFLNNTKINLINPQICLNVIKATKTYKTFVYQQTNRKKMLKYDIQYRPFIGITAMDWEMSVFMCNLLNITKDQIVLDPFVGSGGLLMAACLFDAYVLGIEYDIKMLVGCNEINGNVRTSLKGYNIFDNFRFINKEANVLGIVNGNMFEYKLKKCVDSIITDPPYGDRISLNKKESKCFVVELRKMCDKVLKNNGKVCFWSVCGGEEVIFEDYKLKYKQTQVLGTVTRTLYVFAKLK